MGLNKRLLQGAAAGGLVPSENFKVVTYTGDGTSSQFIDVGFTPDFVWIKGRNTADYHNLIDSSRTAGCFLNTNTTGVEDCNASHAQIETGGFNAKGNPNANGINYVAWCLKANGGTTSSNTDGTITSTVQANTDAGFSIIQYTGTGSNATVGHSLLSAPELVITKKTSASQNWMVGSDGIGWTKYLELNLTNAAATASTTWNNTAPTTTTISLGSSNNGNQGGQTYIMYAFTPVEGFSKFGSYEGNGTTTGPIVETGFEPAFIMIKDVDGTDNWAMVDNKRATTNPRQTWLRANLDNAEFSNTVDSINFYSNGFQIAGGTSVSNFLNENGNTFIYMAFAADPDTEAPTVAKSFFATTYDGTGADGNSITGFGFKPGLLWLKRRNSTADHWLFDIVRGPFKLLESSTSDAENNRTTSVASFDDDGFTIDNDTAYNNTSDDYISWAWKADDNEPTILPNTELSSLISKYKFEDNANDDYGDNNGTASNLSYVSGRFGKAADFNGSSSKILYPQAAPFNDSNTILAISAWVKLDSASDEFVLMSASSTSDQSDYGLLIVGGNRPGRVFLSDAPSNANEYQGTFGSGNDTNWNHYVWQLSASGGIELWYNGTKQTRTTLVSSGSMDETKWFGDLTYATSVQWATGINRVVTTAYSNGSIDQMRLFNSELTSSEISSLYNEANEAIVSANANAGFSIVKYEGTGSNTSVPHGLSAAPELVITKRTDNVANWTVGQFAALGNDGYLKLNTTDSKITATNVWNDTAPTSTVVNIGTSSATNTSGAEYISYCFHSVAGYSKFGSYAGNGTTQSITTGFKPDFVIVKRSAGGTGNWNMFDSVRGEPMLRANTSDAEFTGLRLSFESNGFKMEDGDADRNASGSTYIYMAFKIN